MSDCSSFTLLSLGSVWYRAQSVSAGLSEYWVAEGRMHKLATTVCESSLRKKSFHISEDKEDPGIRNPCSPVIVVGSKIRALLQIWRINHSGLAMEMKQSWLNGLQESYLRCSWQIVSCLVHVTIGALKTIFMVCKSDNGYIYIVPMYSLWSDVNEISLILRKEKQRFREGDIVIASVSVGPLKKVLSPLTPNTTIPSGPAVSWAHEPPVSFV